jgi:ChrR Cupin-like domain
MTAAILLGPPVDPTMLHGAIAAHLHPMPFDRVREAALGLRLSERVRRSAETHRGLLTVRREDGAWRTLGPGVSRRLLRRDADMRIELLRLDADAVLHWPADALAQEVFVLRGELALESDAAALTLLPRHGLCVRAAGAAERWRAVGGEALVYVRDRLAELERLDPTEARWWAAAQGVPPGGGMAGLAWRPLVAGVDVACLFGQGRVVSMLVRLAAGASMSGHGHRIDEDCIMLDGELFVGEILIRAGDFQMAPCGLRHGASFSDTGGMFYFHGALPGASEPT